MNAPNHTQLPDPVFASGQGVKDERQNKDANYDLVSWSSISLSNPVALEKNAAPWVLASSYNGPDARKRDGQLECGEYHLLQADIDKGNPGIEGVVSALQRVLGVCEAKVFSTASSSPEDRRWRIFVPTAVRLNATQYEAFQKAFGAALTEVGLHADNSMAKATQIAFLPNVPRDKRSADGQPIFYQSRHVQGPRFDPTRHQLIARVDAMQREEAERTAQAQIEARRKLDQRIASGLNDKSVIAHFNETNDLELALLARGYIPSPIKPGQGIVANYRSPMQRSGSFATSVMMGSDGIKYAVSKSDSDAAADIGKPTQNGNRRIDAFDVEKYFDHNNDDKAAVKHITQKMRTEAGQLFMVVENPVDPETDAHNLRLLADLVARQHATRAGEATAASAETAPEATATSAAPGMPTTAAVATPAVLTEAQKEQIEALDVPFWEPKDLAAIPHIPFAYSDFYARGYTSLTVAEPKVGKSQLALAEAFDMATGRGLLNGIPQAPLKVLYYNAEDDQNVLDARVSALLTHHGITQAEIEGQLAVVSGIEQPDFYLSSGPEGTINEAAFVKLEKAIDQHGIDVVYFDPLQDMTRSPETVEVFRFLGQRLRRLARQKNVAIGIVHHTRKLSPGMAPTIDDLRGGSSLRGTCRFNRILVKMTEDEGLKAKVDDHRYFFRIGDAETNLAPPSVSLNQWYEKVNTKTANGHSYPALQKWSWPDAFEGITLKHAAAVRDAISERGDDLPREFHTAKDWVGNIVADVLGLDAKNKGDRAQVKSIVTQWIKTGFLQIVSTYDDKAKRSVEYVGVGPESPVAEVGV